MKNETLEIIMWSTVWIIFIVLVATFGYYYWKLNRSRTAKKIQQGLDKFKYRHHYED